MRVVVSGGWSYGNIGDEAIAAATIFLIKKYLCNAEVIYTSYNPNNFYENHEIEAIKSVHAYIEKCSIFDFENIFANTNKYGLTEFEEMFDENTLFIMSGGGYFHEQWKSQFVSRLLEIEIAKKRGAKVVLVGQSIGPFYSSRSKQLLIKALNKVDFLSVRDESSELMLSQLSLPITIHRSPDLAIIMSDVLQDENKSLNENIINIMPASFTSYVGMNSRESNKYIEKIKKRLSPAGIRYRREFQKVVNVLSQREEYSVRIVLSTSWEWDKTFARKIAKRNASNKVEICESSDVYELCSLLMNGRITISTKMHPLIISTSYGLPTIGISYNYKVDDFMKLIDNEKNCFRIDKIDAKKIVGIIDRESVEMQYDCSKLKEDVYKTFMQIANL